MKDNRSIEEEATGCANANGYKAWARERGFKFIEVLDWTSSAGDWAFIISKDGGEWRVLSQSNNWPRPGFSYAISDETFHGTKEDVYAEIELRYS